MTEKTRILVVADEISVAMLMTHLLTRAGCRTKVALTARQGLRLAGEEPFDVITLDVDMPGEMDGFSASRRFREITNDTPIVFVSVYTDVQRGKTLGAADYIVKPFDGADFVRRVISQIAVKSPTATL